MVGDAAELIALTTAALYRSHDLGATWHILDINLPLASVMDVAVHEQTLFVLLVGGQILQIER